MTEIGSSSLTNAAGWLEGALLGPIATTLAVIAMATVGFLMLSGRINWRRAATTVIGCFLLFGAPTIAAGFIGAARSGSAHDMQVGSIEPFVPAASSVTPPPAPATGQPKTVCWTCGIAPDDQIRTGN